MGMKKKDEPMKPPTKLMLDLWETFLEDDRLLQPDWKRVAARLLGEVRRLRTAQRPRRN